MDQQVNRVKVGMRMDMGWKGKLIGGSTSGSQTRTGRQAIKDILIWKAIHALTGACLTVGMADGSISMLADHRFLKVAGDP
jgi:hypothetical protein